MDEKQLFGMALGLRSPWFVASCSFDAEQKQLDWLWGRLLTLDSGYGVDS